MPRGIKKIGKNGSKSTLNASKVKKTVANVNSNRSDSTMSTRKWHLVHDEQSFRPKVKSKVVKPNVADVHKVVAGSGKDSQAKETVSFEEEGELIEMEIDDGGEAALQFASEDEVNSDNDNQTGNESENSEPESGEITPSQITYDEQLEADCYTTSRQIGKLDQQKGCDSVEERLDTMSSTLLAMKEITEKSGILDPQKLISDNLNLHKEKKLGKSMAKADEQANLSISETTIYRSALQKEASVDKQGGLVNMDWQVDPEISFKPQESENVKNRFSSSSEEPVDTSDEMIDDIGMAFNDRFIADCESRLLLSRK